MSHDEASHSELRRALGPAMATALVVGNVIGSGIFLKPGNIAAASGNLPLILTLWLGGGMLCLCGALCFAELGTMFPQAGGIYVYLKHAYGRLVAFLFGWTEFILLRPASIGALAVAFVGSLTLTLNWNASPAWRFGLCLALILGMSWINILGVLWGGSMQLVTTLIKVGFLVLVATAPFWSAPWSGWQVSTDNFASAPPQPAGTTLSAQIAMVLLAVLWAYDGWHGVTPLAEEIRDPQRNIPFALLGGLGLLIALYLAANVAYHSVMPMAAMQAAGDHAAERMLQQLAGRSGQTAMSAVIMCSTFGAINSNILMAPRIPFAMGRDGLFLKPLAFVHPNYRTPVFAILTTAAMATLLIGIVTLGKVWADGLPADSDRLGRLAQSLRDGTVFGLLTNCFVFAASLFYALAVFAVIVLRRRLPAQPRPFRTWGYPLTPLLFTCIYAWFLWQVYAHNPAESRTGALCIATGLPVFAFFRWRRRGQIGSERA